MFGCLRLDRAGEEFAAARDAVTAALVAAHLQQLTGSWVLCGFPATLAQAKFPIGPSVSSLIFSSFFIAETLYVQFSLSLSLSFRTCLKVTRTRHHRAPSSVGVLATAVSRKRRRIWIFEKRLFEHHLSGYSDCDVDEALEKLAELCGDKKKKKDKAADKKRKSKAEQDAAPTPHAEQRLNTHTGAVRESGVETECTRLSLEGVYVWTEFWGARATRQTRYVERSIVPESGTTGKTIRYRVTRRERDVTR